MSYLLLPDKKVVLLSDPAKVCSLVPSARPLNYQGRELAAVPFGLGEVHLLRSAGYNVPSPIGYEYPFAGRWPSLSHQRETAAFTTLHPRGYVLNEMGTMKTLSILWAADYLMRKGVIRRALIVSPLSTLERVWGDEIFTNFTDRTFAVLHGSARRRLKLLAQPHDFYIVNYDGIEIIEAALEKRSDIGLFILDELALGYRNATPARYKTMARVIKPHHWVWGLTGTPTPHAPTDAWAQCRLITPATVPKYFSTWRNETMVQVKAFKWEPRPEATQLVYRAMRPAIRFTRDECLELPPTVTQTQTAPLSTEQKRYYAEMVEKLRIEVQEGKVTAANAGVKAIRLLQIASGVVYDVDGRHLEIDCKPRVQLTMDMIEEASAKVIVFASFTGTVHMLHRELSKHWSCAMIYGQISARQRDETFAAFQKTPEPRIIVADPGTMSHGLTLTEAATIIWYGPPKSNDVYRQANGRISRPGQKHQALIANIVSTPLERARYRDYEKQQDNQGLLLDMIQRGEEL